MSANQLITSPPDAHPMPNHQPAHNPASTQHRSATTIPVPSINIILPVYNEAGLVPKVFDDVRDFADQHPNYHFLFVDDGSRDDTAKLLNRLIAQNASNQINLLSYSPNGGKGFAIKTAVQQNTDDFVCFIDGDLAYSLDHLPLLAEALKLNDVVIGSRSLVESSQKNIKPMRRFMGWVFNRVARLVLHLPHRDTQAGLKGFRKDAARHIFSKQQMLDFSFDVELVFLAHKYGYLIGEVAARVSDTHSYKISTVNMLRDPLKMFLAIIKIRLNSIAGKYQ